MKASKSMISCPVCHGTVLKHRKKLLIEDADICKIIQQPINHVIKAFGRLTGLEKLKAIVGGDMSLTKDVALLPKETQVALKMLELEQAAWWIMKWFYKMFTHLEIVFKAKSKHSAARMRLQSEILPVLPILGNHYKKVFYQWKIQKNNVCL